ncbi:MAG TPA: hypothetical protein VMU04_18295 [Candidatus Acidoferrum sp.]|nr:hypothetical protein [Candidatus Acidoferrum sp.]
MEYTLDEEMKALTVLVWILAVPVVFFVGYLLWRKFGPNRRHRRHGSRLRRYLGQ